MYTFSFYTLLHELFERPKYVNSKLRVYLLVATQIQCNQLFECRVFLLNENDSSFSKTLMCCRLLKLFHWFNSTIFV
jgi:hypothetical protein